MPSRGSRQPDQITPSLFDLIRDDTDCTVSDEKWSPPGASPEPRRGAKGEGSFLKLANPLPAIIARRWLGYLLRLCLPLVTGWSKSFSAAERSVDGKRVRQFHADEVIAFARAFEVPLTAFLLPPEDDPPDVVELGGPQSLPLREFVLLISPPRPTGVKRDELFKLFEEWLAHRTALTPLQRALLKKEDDDG